MALNPLQGLCPSPFLEETNFPATGGNVNGRLCAPVPQIAPNLTCCLPCPFTEWVYPDSFNTWFSVAEWLSVVGVIICVFLLLSWAVLPPEKTRRHYLSTCLVIGIFFMGLAFVVPLGSKPPECYNEITPNDMFTNLTCAFSGAFIIAGALSAGVWVFIRTLSMHLQICWDIVPGEKFFYASMGLGWGVAAIFFIMTMTFTGVSFRFGDACHVNAVNSVKDFWGPLLAIAAGSGLVQIFTFLYCIKVYLQNMWNDDATETTNSTGLPSFNTSIRAHSVRAVYRRVRRVLWLQWRSITIVIFLLVDIVLFSVIWVILDNNINAAANGDITHFMPYLLCLVGSAGDRSKCFGLGQQALVNEATAIALLMMISLAGIEAGLMMGRVQMFTGWYEFFKNKFTTKREFVSLDAKQYTSDQRTFELYKMGHSDVRVPPGSSGMMSGYSAKAEYYQPDQEREWRKPTMSFAGPQAPSNAANRMNWHMPHNAGARGGLGLHPPRSPSIPHDDDDELDNRI